MQSIPDESEKNCSRYGQVSVSWPNILPKFSDIFAKQFSSFHIVLEKFRPLRDTQPCGILLDKAIFSHKLPFADFIPRRPLGCSPRQTMGGLVAVDVTLQICDVKHYFAVLQQLLHHWHSATDSSNLHLIYTPKSDFQISRTLRWKCCFFAHRNLGSQSLMLRGLMSMEKEIWAVKKECIYCNWMNGCSRKRRRSDENIRVY